MARTMVLGVLMALFCGTVIADYRDELRELMSRVEALAEDRDDRNEADRFRELVDIGFDYVMLAYPEIATYRGDPRGRGRWTDRSLAAIERRQADERRMLAALDSIDRDQLEPADRVNFDLYRLQLVERVEGQRYPNELLPINQMDGPQQSVARLMAIIRPRDIGDYEGMIARLKKTPELIDQTIALMRKGMEEGVTPPRITLREVPQQIRNQLADEPAESPALIGFRRFPETLDSMQRESLRVRARQAYREDMAPAFEKLLAFMEREYIPAARDSVALRALPDGKAWYAHEVKWRTTTDLTPGEIHEIGLQEVARIGAEMARVMQATGFEGSRAEFFGFLRNDPRFYHDSAEALLMEYRDIAKRADPELMKLFGHLPRTPYGVIAVPAYAEKSQTTAYYQRGSVEAGRPGYFYANTYALDTRPRWEMEALTLHEAVPGHHLQLAIQDELEDMPWFRRFARVTAFTEGWGLYAESLGEEMGFYTDPYSRFGQLTYEIWRAIRLVVDTGLHHLGWGRQQAIDYFMENAGKQEHDVIVEVDRYIVWPGQALAYKIGEMKIRELRAWASGQLGPDFDIRGFHDTVLGQGAIPLGMLERNVRSWVAGQAAGR